MRVGLVCSQGGHLTEMLELREAFEGHDIFWASYHSARADELRAVGPAYFTQNVGTSVWRMLLMFPWALRILLRERPDVIISSGAEIAVPFLYVAKLLGIKTMYIESWCRVETISLTGRLVRPIVDAFYVQWPQLVKVGGRKARYKGAVV